MTTKKSDDQKLAIVRIDGTGITKGGEEVRTKFFKDLSLDLDDYSHLSFTPEEAVRINNHLTKLKTGSTAVVPMICGGDRCPVAIAGRCVLFNMNKSPVGLSCLVEVEMIKQFIIQYMTEYEVDPENFTEVSFCGELADIEIYLWRINNNLARSDNASLIVQEAVGTDREGNPIVQSKISPSFDIREKLLNRKAKIIKLMVGDRQERYKKEAALKQKEESDPSSKQARMRQQLESLQRKLDTHTQSPNILTPDAILMEDDED